MEGDPLFFQKGKVPLLQTETAAFHLGGIGRCRVLQIRGPVVAHGMQPQDGVIRLPNMDLEQLRIALALGGAHDLVPQVRFSPLGKPLINPLNFLLSDYRESAE